ncbi:redox-sensitive transcriptional activator SoxR [Sporichthya polymorpha]|uniref:redox-sensitive transcriptional activator SoxR n=1 Tax=Sporichthya polymorpha TaxID=35751 RepID=UPI0003642145|nr:redox-sensitive transcriptional activator SoxR [Sporichthya polymorpha]
MKPAEELLTIGEVAERAGFATSAIRFYDKEGLVVAVRTSGNQRRYPRSALRRLAFIRAAQNVGVPLAEIREALAELPDTRTPTKADWARLSRHWRARLDAQIEGLTALRDNLDSCIGCGCLSLQRCALYNPGDVAATRGPGAQRLPRSIREPHHS